MPQVTVYIRKEDLEKWRAIEKKSEFMHQALLGVELMDLPMAYNPETKELQGKPLGDLLTTD